MTVFTDLTDAEIRSNIRTSHDRADGKCIDQGMDWYPATNRLVTAFATVANVDPAVVAGIVAVLSPRSAWHTNVTNTAAALVLAGHLTPDQAIDILDAHGYQPKDGVWRMDSVRGLGKSVDKAMAIASLVAHGIDTVDQYVTGQKVRSFFSNILDPATSDDVTIDAWSAGVAAGRRLSTAEMSGLTPKQYMRLSEQYRIVAAELGIMPSELQAISWCEIRGRSR